MTARKRDAVPSAATSNNGHGPHLIGLHRPHHMAAVRTTTRTTRDCPTYPRHRRHSAITRRRSGQQLEAARSRAARGADRERVHAGTVVLVVAISCRGQRASVANDHSGRRADRRGCCRGRNGRWRTSRTRTAATHPQDVEHPATRTSAAYIGRARLGGDGAQRTSIRLQPTLERRKVRW